MFELIRKSFLAGLGVVVLTKEKVQEFTRMLVEEGRLSTEEADKLADDLVKSGQRQWEEINAKTQETVKKLVNAVDFVRRKEFQDLTARVEALEQRLGMTADTKEADEPKAEGS